MRANAVIAGAGIAGVSTAYQLAVKRGFEKVVVVDPRSPLTLTSDKSAECFRNWWPNAPMVDLMNRSIELLESYAAASEGAFHLNRRGYLYVTASEQKLAQMLTEADLIESLGGGPGDRYRNGEELQAKFPFLTEAAVGAIHARNAGWFSAQQLGSWMIAQAQQKGLELIRASVTGVELARDEVTAVETDQGRIETDVFVNAAGPMVKPVAKLVGVDLPVFSEVHIKIAFRDHLKIIPRSSPMMIWADPQTVDWSPEERQWLEDEGRTDLITEMPSSCHYRPEGGEGSDWVVALWEYHRLIQEPSWPLPDDPIYPETVLRGLTTAVPALAAYRDHLPQPVVDGGYYTKTSENRPLVCPLPIAGAYLVGAFSGFGVMASSAAGELAAQIICGDPLPSYAPAFDLRRYEDPGYLDEVAATTNTGQI